MGLSCPAMKRRDSGYSEIPKVASVTVAELEIKSRSLDCLSRGIFKCGNNYHMRIRSA